MHREAPAQSVPSQPPPAGTPCLSHQEQPSPSPGGLQFLARRVKACLCKFRSRATFLWALRRSPGPGDVSSQGTGQVGGPASDPRAARAAHLSSHSVDSTAPRRDEAAPETTRQAPAAEAPPRKEEPRAKGGCGQSHTEPGQSLAPASSGERSHLPRAVCLEGKRCASSDSLSQGPPRQPSGRPHTYTPSPRRSCCASWGRLSRAASPQPEPRGAHRHKTSTVAASAHSPTRRRASERPLREESDSSISAADAVPGRIGWGQHVPGAQSCDVRHKEDTGC